MEKVIAVNYARVGNFLGIKFKEETDLLKCDDEKVKKFILDYSEYLSANKIAKLKEFYYLTGLMITHIYENDSHEDRTIYSMNNIFRENIIHKVKPVYTTHILVISKKDTNNYEYFKEIFDKNQKELQIGSNIRYTLSCVCRNTKSKISEIENHYNKDAFSGIDKKQVKEIYLTLLNNLCILLKNGDLYLDGKLYASKVDTIWHQDSYNVYIIYKDNRLEKLISEFPNSNIIKYKKIVYNAYTLATLKSKTVSLTQLVDLPDTCVMTSILDVDDIECNKYMLFLIINGKKIRIPSWYNTIVVNNSKN